MIVVKVELWSAVNGRRQELARMRIANDGETTLANPNLGAYLGETLRGRSTSTLDRGLVQRRGRVGEWPRHALHVWNLVARMLAAMGYDQGPVATPETTDDPAAHQVSQEILELLDDKLGEETSIEEIGTVFAGALSGLVQFLWQYRPPGQTPAALVAAVTVATRSFVDQLASQDAGETVQ